MTQIVPVGVPSYRAFHRLTSDFLPSFAQHIYGQGRYGYSLVLNCEGYSDAQLAAIRTLCDRLLPDAYTLVTNTYPKPPPLTRIRHETCLVMRDHSVHLISDDDMEFRPGSVACYDTAVDFMVANPQCGMVVCKSFLGGSKWGEIPRPAFGAYAFIGQGLIVRMIRDADCLTMFPDSVLDIPGRFEDVYLGFHYWSRGYYVAKLFNVPTIHRHSAWGSDEIKKCREGSQAVPLNMNGKNPGIVIPGMGAAINQLLGDHFYSTGTPVNMKRMLKYRPREWFWRDYVHAAIQRFGSWALEGADMDVIQRGYSTRLSKLGILG